MEAYTSASDGRRFGSFVCVCVCVCARARVKGAHSRTTTLKAARRGSAAAREVPASAPNLHRLRRGKKGGGGDQSRRGACVRVRMRQVWSFCAGVRVRVRGRGQKRQWRRTGVGGWDVGGSLEGLEGAWEESAAALPSPGHWRAHREGWRYWRARAWRAVRRGRIAATAAPPEGPMSLNL